MGADNAAHAPGAEWKAIVQRNGAKESVAAFAWNAVLETSTLNGPCIGAEAIATVFAAVAGGMYDSLTFTSETVDGRKTYLEWEGKAFGKDVGGATILTHNAAGLIENVRLYHRHSKWCSSFRKDWQNAWKGRSIQACSGGLSRCLPIASDRYLRKIVDVRHASAAA